MPGLYDQESTLRVLADRIICFFTLCSNLKLCTLEPYPFHIQNPSLCSLTTRSYKVLGRIPFLFTTKVRLWNPPGSGHLPSCRPQEARRGEAEYLILVQSSVTVESEHRVKVYTLLSHVALLGPSVLAATWRPSRVKNPRY